MSEERQHGAGIHSGSDSELIALLKQTISDQEARIDQLERTIQKWEKKYREHLYQNSSLPPKIDRERAKESTLSVFTREFANLQ